MTAKKHKYWYHVILYNCTNCYSFISKTFDPMSHEKQNVIKKFYSNFPVTTLLPEFQY